MNLNTCSLWRNNIWDIPRKFHCCLSCSQRTDGVTHSNNETFGFKLQVSVSVFSPKKAVSSWSVTKCQWHTLEYGHFLKLSFNSVWFLLLVKIYDAYGQWLSWHWVGLSWILQPLMEMISLSDLFLNGLWWVLEVHFPQLRAILVRYKCWFKVYSIFENWCVHV